MQVHAASDLCRRLSQPTVFVVYAIVHFYKVDARQSYFIAVLINGPVDINTGIVMGIRL